MFTMTLCWLDSSPSDTVAVTVCVPTLRLLATTCGPLPSAPSRSDCHTIAPPRSPDSASLAVAWNVTGVPESKVAPPAGEAIVSTGGWFWPGATCSENEETLESPPLSATETATTNVPLSVGTPDNRPSAVSVIPDGRAPPDRLHVYGGIPPTTWR